MLTLAQALEPDRAESPYPVCCTRTPLDVACRYVAVSYGVLDTDSRNFSMVFAASLAIANVFAAYAIIDLEKSNAENKGDVIIYVTSNS